MFLRCVLEDFEGHYENDIQGMSHMSGLLARRYDADSVTLPVPTQHLHVLGVDVIRFWVFVPCISEDQGNALFEDLEEVVSNFAYLNHCGFSETTEIPDL